MLAMQVLGDEGAQLNGICDEEEEPVEEDYTVGIARPPVLNVLDVKYDAERNKCQDGGPEAKVASPYILVVLDL
jgi:hypothetical protein